MKTAGGLTHVRGMTDCVMNRWVLSVPFVNNICIKLELFANHYSTLSEQHIEVRESLRILRNDTDMEKLFSWVSLNTPFLDCHYVMSIVTGTTGGDSVNCDKVYEIGLKRSMNGSNFYDIKLKRSSIQISNEIVRIITLYYDFSVSQLSNK